MRDRQIEAGPKGVSSVVAYVLIFAMAMALTSTVYMYTIPRLADMRAKGELGYVAVYMARLDDGIRTVSHGGEDSKEYINFNLQQGVLRVYDIGDRIEYSITSNACMFIDVTPGVYFEARAADLCVNKLILNYTMVDIANNATLTGFFQLHIENVGFLNNKPVLTIS